MKHRKRNWLFLVTLLAAAEMLAAEEDWKSLSVQLSFNPYAESFASQDDSIRASWFWYEEGRRFEAKKFKVDSAMYAYERANDLNPQNLEIALRRGTLLTRYNHYQAAIACYDRMLPFAPESIELLVAKADAHWILKQYDQSWSANRAALKLAPQRTDLFRKVIQNCLTAGEHEHSLELYRELQQMYPDSAWVWSGYGGILAWNLKRFEEGIEFFDKAVALDSSNPEEHAGRAQALTEMGRIDDALKDWDTAITLAQGDSAKVAWYQHLKSQDLAIAGRYADAVSEYEEAVVLDPSSGLAWYDLGQLRRRQRKPLESQLEAFNKAIENTSGVAPYMLFSKAEVLRELGRTDEALAVFSEALEIQPDFAEMWMRKGWLLRSLQRYEEAMQCVREAERYFVNDGQPPYWKSILNLRADLHLSLGNIIQALQAADTCIALDPRFDNPWRVRGVALAQMGKMKDAEKSLIEATRRGRGDHENWRDLGALQLQLGRYDHAVESCSFAIGLDSTDMISRKTLAVAQCHDRQFDAALGNLITALLADTAWQQGYYCRARIYTLKLQPCEALRDIETLLALEPAYFDSVIANDDFLGLRDEPEYDRLLDDRNSHQTTKP